MKKILGALAVLLLMKSTVVFAQDTDESMVGYDSIVDQLSTPKSRAYLNSADPFSGLLLHAGLGMAMSMTNVNTGKRSHNGFLQGIELNLAIDLFSPNWMAEGSYLNLGRTKINIASKEDRISLNEFDLKLVYHTSLGQLFSFRTGFGLAARYLAYKNALLGEEKQYTTPDWMAFIGMEAKLSNTLTFGTELAYKTAMIDETIDESALSAGVRLDAHF